MQWKQQVRIDCDKSDVHIITNEICEQFNVLCLDSILARLAIINLTHEAKGLDTYNFTRDKFLQAGDFRSVEILDKNYGEEIGHVGLGVKWFSYICKSQSLEPISTFHEYSKTYFRGKLKAPFNTEARDTAGLSESWYLPLAAE